MTITEQLPRVEADPVPIESGAPEGRRFIFDECPPWCQNEWCRRGAIYLEDAQHWAHAGHDVPLTLMASDWARPDEPVTVLEISHARANVVRDHGKADEVELAIGDHFDVRMTPGEALGVARALVDAARILGIEHVELTGGDAR